MYTYIAYCLLPISSGDCRAGQSSSLVAWMTKRLWSDIETVRPEAVGMSCEGLRRLRKATQLDVDTESIAGVAHIVLRRGRCVFSQAAGWADREQGRRFGVGTICHLHGATKPLVVTAFL